MGIQINHPKASSSVEHERGFLHSNEHSAAPDLPAGLQLVNVHGDRYKEWLDCSFATFGYTTECDPGIIKFLSTTYASERAIAVTNKANYVATAAAIDLDLVLPGGGRVDMAAVTAVAVDPTATRQGVLSSMMSHLHQRAVDEGRPIAGLVPSEWPIYGRFGYGPATWFDSLTIEVRAVRWRDDAPGSDLRPRIIGGEEARALAQVLHPRQASATPGDVLRPASYWDRFVMASSSHRLDALLGLASGPAGPRRYVAVADRGLVSYRVTPGWTPHATPSGTLEVIDLLAADPAAAAALWRHLLSVDLVAEIHMPRVAVDDSLPWWVIDPRYIQPRRHDGLWLRPLAVPTLLEGRVWSGTGALTIAIHDQEGYASGCFRLEVDAGHASCVRTTTSPDLEMGVGELGAILFGGTSATNLTRSGRIHSPNAHDAQLWDALAIPERAPFLSYTF